MTLAAEILDPPNELVRPSLWSSFSVFRETFLSLHLNRKNAESFRNLGRFLYEGLLADVDDQRPERDDEITVVRLRAAALDLRYLQGFLHSIERELDDLEAGVLAAPLCLEARAAVPQIAALAQRLEDAVAGVITQIHGAAAESTREVPSPRR